mmetsp:Transcript_3761/g.11941  ORF Transcript_3761/g.11941 Transcript_3761/m.11941 type:complete len:215 (-) Transcript_3761:242-886(-)
MRQGRRFEGRGVARVHGFDRSLQRIQALGDGSGGLVPRADNRGEVREGQGSLAAGLQVREVQHVEDVAPRGLGVQRHALEVPVGVALKKQVVGVAFGCYRLPQKTHKQRTILARLQGYASTLLRKQVDNAILVQLVKGDGHFHFFTVGTRAKGLKERGDAPRNEPPVGKPLRPPSDREGLPAARGAQGDEGGALEVLERVQDRHLRNHLEDLLL